MNTRKLLVRLSALLLLCCAVFLASCDDDDTATCDGGHELGTAQVVLEEPSCTTAGRATAKCTKCGTEGEIEIPATGHTAGDAEIVKGATVCASSYKVTSCTVCGTVLSSEEHEKSSTPCTAGEWEMLATLSKKVRKCVYCGREMESVVYEYDANGRLKDDLPSDLNFEGEVIKVLGWNSEDPEFEVETKTGDVVEDAIYDRNDRIEERLNVELKWYSQNGAGGSETTAFTQHVEAQFNTGTKMYDIIASYSRTMGVLAVQGFLYNLATIEEDNYINLEQPWWPAQLVETVNFGDAYYFISGDMATSVLYMMHNIFFNKDLYKRYGVDDSELYQLVYDGEWTLDKMIELTADRYADSDNVEGVSDGDTYGFISLHYIVDSFYPGSNLRLLDDDDEDMLVISADYGSAKTARLVEKLGSWAQSDAVWIHNSSKEDKSTRSVTQAAFTSGRAFMTLQHSKVGKNYAGLAFEVGMLPTPKYDAQQINYYTGMGNPYSLYGIFVDFDERGDKAATLSMLTAVLECWASEGYRLTTPAITDSIGLATQDDANMMEYVRAGVTFDLGQIFAAELSDMPDRASYAICENTVWLEVYPYYKESLDAQLEQLVANFRLIQAERDAN